MTLSIGLFLFFLIFSFIVIYENVTYVSRLKKVELNIKKNNIESAFKILSSIFVREEYKYRIYLSYYYIYFVKGKWYTANYYLNLIIENPHIYKRLSQPEKIHYKKAIVLEKLEDYKAALSEYKHIELINPKFIKSLERYGKLLNQLNNYGEALEKIEKAYQLSKDKYLLSLLIELNFRTQNYRQCFIYADILSKYPIKNSQNELILYYCACSYYFLRRYSEALKTLKLSKKVPSTLDEDVSNNINTVNNNINDINPRRSLLQILIDYKLMSENDKDANTNQHYINVFKEALTEDIDYDKNVLLDAKYYYANVLFAARKIEEGYRELESIRKINSKYKNVVRKLRIYKEIFNEHLLQEMFVNKDQIYVMNHYIYPLFKNVAIKNFIGSVIGESLIVVEFSKNHGISKVLQTICCFYSGHDSLPLFILKKLLRKYHSGIFYLYSPLGVSHQSWKLIKNTNTDIRMIKHYDMVKFIGGHNIFHVDIKIESRAKKKK